VELASVHFWPAWLGGLCVALIAVAYPVLTGRLLGVSGLYDLLLTSLRRRPAEETQTVSSMAELEAALAAATLEAFGDDVVADDEPGAVSGASGPEVAQVLAATLSPTRTRPLFLVGLILGAALASLSAGDSWTLTSLGSHFDERFGGDLAVGVVSLFVSGCMIGLGTRIAGGCTSGHGISGLACFQVGSFVSTATFWSTGTLVAWLFFWGLS